MPRFVHRPQLALLVALLSACASTEGPPPKGETVTSRETPWSLTFHDGSGNTYRFWEDAPGAPRYAFDPVTPARSSSGTYSGGTPRSGRLPVRELKALWTQAEALEGDPALHVQARAMGTGSFHLKTPAGERTFLIARCAALEHFLALVEPYSAP